MAEVKGGVPHKQESLDEDKRDIGTPDTSESLEEIDAKDIEEDDDTSIEIVSRSASDTSSMESPAKKAATFPEEQKLAGWLKLGSTGFRKAVKNLWFVYGDDTGKLYYYRQQQDLLPLGEINIRSSSLTYDACNRDKPGLFEIRSEGRVYQLEAPDRVRMLYWLEALQAKRRAFSLRQSTIAQDLLRGNKKRLDASGLLGGETVDVNLRSANTHGINLSDDHQKTPQFWSLLNLRTEIRNAFSTMRFAGNHKEDSPSVSSPNEDWSLITDYSSLPETSTLIMAQEASQNKSSTQWHISFDEQVSSPRDELSKVDPCTQTSRTPRFDTLNLAFQPGEDSQNLLTEKTDSDNNFTTAGQAAVSINSATSDSPTGNTVANGKSKFMSSLRNNFRMMKESVREKNFKINTSLKQLQSSSSQNTGSTVDNTLTCYRCRALSDDLLSVKEDLRAVEEELQANREIVHLLEKELDIVRSEMNTRRESLGRNEEQMLEVLKLKDKHIIELEHSRVALLDEKSLLAQENRLKDNVLLELRDQISMFQQTLAVKDELIVSLTNQNQELMNNNKNNNQSLVDLGEGQVHNTYLNNPLSLVAEKKELERLTDTVRAYEEQNKFLTREILELNSLRQNDEARERLLIVNVAELEGKYLQTRSKYLYLLNERQVPVRGGDNNKSQEVVNQLLQEALESESNESRVETSRKKFITSQGKEFDHYGFLKYKQEDVDFLVSRADDLQRQSVQIEYLIRDTEDDTSRRVKWENFIIGLSTNKHLTRCEELKLLVRYGVPQEFRERIWKGLIDLYVKQTCIKLGVNYYKDLEVRADNNKSNPAIKQIELDLLRTLPDNRYFENMDSPGIQKLRRVLMCYSIHNPLIGYCQGINRIAAIALLFLCEEDAFWCLVAIIEHLMPCDYFTTTLAAAQADQRVLKELMLEKCPKLSAHLDQHDVDISLFTFNLFLTIFIDGVRPELFLRIWDVFLYEGSKVLFRFALAFLKYAEEDILQQPNNLAINKYMRTLGATITDVKKVHQIAFHELNPFPMRSIVSKRQHHLQQVKLELEELESIRKDLRSAHEEEDPKDLGQGYFSEDDLEDCG